MAKRRSIVLVALLLFGTLAARPAGASPALERGDRSWAARADGQVAAQARPEPIRAAIEAYREALAKEPERLDAHWKLQRALWFAGDFATPDRVSEHALYEQAISAADAALATLAARAGGGGVLEEASPEQLAERVAPADRSDAAHFFFWHAVNLGAWARGAGLLEAVRGGIAGRLHEATLRSLALDPSVEQGGALRLLSRLHAELPRVPLFSGWVDHTRAIPLAERALAEYPGHPGNGFLLGLTLLERSPARRGEAIGWMERTATLEPRADQVVEDTSIRITAQEELARLEKAQRTTAADQPAS